MKADTMILQLRSTNYVIFGLVSLVAMGTLAGCSPGVEMEVVKKGGNDSAEYAEPSVPPYDEDADGHQQLSQAMDRAQKEGKRVFVIWGANWCSMCRHLQVEFEENEKIQALIQENYVEVKINIGTRDTHMELAREYGLDFDNLGIPYLSILDADGSVAATLNGEGIFEEIAEGDGLKGSGNVYLKGRIAEFLSRNSPKDTG